MVQMLPLRDREFLAELNQKEGTDAGLAYCLHDGGEITGYVLYDIAPEEGRIRAVNAPDEPSFDGLVRSVFSSLFDASVNRAVFDEGVDSARLERLGFTAPGQRVTPSIEDVLYLCKHCKGHCS